MEKLSLKFRAQIIAGSNPQLLPGGTRYKRVYDTALRELQEAVGQALDEDVDKIVERLERGELN